MTGYTGFSGDAAEQKGYYLVLHATAASGATISAELQNGLHGPVTLDDDGILIVRISDPETQDLKYTVTKGDVTEVMYFDLSGLTLEAQA